MKSKLMIITLIFGVLLSFSCKKKEAVQTVSSGEGSQQQQIVVPGIVNPGYVLRVNSGIYSQLENDTGSPTDKTKWVDAMSLGEKVMTGNVRRATYSGDEKVYDFMEIRRDNGVEGYALAMQVAAGGRLAVVTDEKANLFKSPKAVDVTSTILSRKTVVVYFPETETSGFVEIRGYDPEKQTYIRLDSCFIRLSSLSRNDSDIQSSILMQTALALTNSRDKVRKDALLESAILDYPDSVFYSEIYELVYPSSSGDPIYDLSDLSNE